MEETNTSGTENNVENGTPETGGGTSASTQTNMSATIQEVLTDIITSDASANVQESIDSKVLKAVKETFEENEDIKDLVNFKKLTLNMFNEEKTEKIEPIEDFVHKLLLVDEKFKNDFQKQIKEDYNNKNKGINDVFKILNNFSKEGSNKITENVNPDEVVNFALKVFKNSVKDNLKIKVNELKKDNKLNNLLGNLKSIEEEYQVKYNDLLKNKFLGGKSDLAKSEENLNASNSELANIEGNSNASNGELSSNSSNTEINISISSSDLLNSGANSPSSLPRTRSLRNSTEFQTAQKKIEESAKAYRNKIRQIYVDCINESNEAVASVFNTNKVYDNSIIKDLNEKVESAKENFEEAEKKYKELCKKIDDVQKFADESNKAEIFYDYRNAQNKLNFFNERLNAQEGDPFYERKTDIANIVFDSIKKSEDGKDAVRKLNASLISAEIENYFKVSSNDYGTFAVFNEDINNIKEGIITKILSIVNTGNHEGNVINGFCDSYDINIELFVNYVMCGCLNDFVAIMKRIFINFAPDKVKSIADKIIEKVNNSNFSVDLQSGDAFTAILNIANGIIGNIVEITNDTDENSTNWFNEEDINKIKGDISKAIPGTYENIEVNIGNVINKEKINFGEKVSKFNEILKCNDGNEKIIRKMQEFDKLNFCKTYNDFLEILTNMLCYYSENSANDYVASSILRDKIQQNLNDLIKSNDLSNYFFESDERADKSKFISIYNEFAEKSYTRSIAKVFKNLNDIVNVIHKNDTDDMKNLKNISEIISEIIIEIEKISRDMQINLEQKDFNKLNTKISELKNPEELNNFANELISIAMKVVGSILLKSKVDIKKEIESLKSLEKINVESNDFISLPLNQKKEKIKKNILCIQKLINQFMAADSNQLLEFYKNVTERVSQDIAEVISILNYKGETINSSLNEDSIDLAAKIVNAFIDLINENGLNMKQYNFDLGLKEYRNIFLRLNFDDIFEITKSMLLNLSSEEEKINLIQKFFLVPKNITEKIYPWIQDYQDKNKDIIIGYMCAFSESIYQKDDAYYEILKSKFDKENDSRENGKFCDDTIFEYIKKRYIIEEIIRDNQKGQTGNKILNSVCNDVLRKLGYDDWRYGNSSELNEENNKIYDEVKQVYDEMYPNKNESNNSVNSEKHQAYEWGFFCKLLIDNYDHKFVKQKCFIDEKEKEKLSTWISNETNQDFLKLQYWYILNNKKNNLQYNKEELNNRINLFYPSKKYLEKITETNIDDISKLYLGEINQDEFGKKYGVNLNQNQISNEDEFNFVNNCINLLFPFCNTDKKNELLCDAIIKIENIYREHEEISAFNSVQDDGKDNRMKNICASLNASLKKKSGQFEQKKSESNQNVSLIQSSSSSSITSISEQNSVSTTIASEIRAANEELQKVKLAMEKSKLTAKEILSDKKFFGVLNSVLNYLVLIQNNQDRNKINIYSIICTAILIHVCPDQKNVILENCLMWQKSALSSKFKKLPKVLFDIEELKNASGIFKDPSCFENGSMQIAIPAIEKWSESLKSYIDIKLSSKRAELAKLIDVQFNELTNFSDDDINDLQEQFSCFSNEKNNVNGILSIIVAKLDEIESENDKISKLDVLYFKYKFFIALLKKEDVEKENLFNNESVIYKIGKGVFEFQEDANTPKLMNMKAEIFKLLVDNNKSIKEKFNSVVYSSADESQKKEYDKKMLQEINKIVNQKLFEEYNSKGLNFFEFGEENFKNFINNKIETIEDLLALADNLKINNRDFLNSLKSTINAKVIDILVKDKYLTSQVSNGEIQYNEETNKFDFAVECAVKDAFLLIECKNRIFDKGDLSKFFNMDSDNFAKKIKVYENFFVSDASKDKKNCNFVEYEYKIFKSGLRNLYDKLKYYYDKKIKDEKTANNNYLEEFQHFIGFFAQDNSQAVQVNENNCLEILKPYFDSVDQNNYSIADNAFEKFQPLFAAIAKNDNLRPYIFGEYMNNENEFTTLIDEKVKIDSNLINLAIFRDLIDNRPKRSVINPDECICKLQKYNDMEENSKHSLWLVCYFKLNLNTLFDKLKEMKDLKDKVRREEIIAVVNIIFAKKYLEYGGKKSVLNKLILQLKLKCIEISGDINNDLKADSAQFLNFVLDNIYVPNELVYSEENLKFFKTYLYFLNGLNNKFEKTDIKFYIKNFENVYEVFKKFKEKGLLNDEIKLYLVSTIIDIYQKLGYTVEFKAEKWIHYAVRVWAGDIDYSQQFFKDKVEKLGIAIKNNKGDKSLILNFNIVQTLINVMKTDDKNKNYLCLLPVSLHDCVDSVVSYVSNKSKNADIQLQDTAYVYRIIAKNCNSTGGFVNIQNSNMPTSELVFHGLKYKNDEIEVLTAMQDVNNKKIKSEDKQKFEDVIQALDANIEETENKEENKINSLFKFDYKLFEAEDYSNTLSKGDVENYNKGEFSELNSDCIYKLSMSFYSNVLNENYHELLLDISTVSKTKMCERVRIIINSIIEKFISKEIDINVAKGSINQLINFMDFQGEELYGTKIVKMVLLEKNYLNNPSLYLNGEYIYKEILFNKTRSDEVCNNYPEIKQELSLIYNLLRDEFNKDKECYFSEVINSLNEFIEQKLPKMELQSKTTDDMSLRKILDELNKSLNKINENTNNENADSESLRYVYPFVERIIPELYLGFEKILSQINYKNIKEFSVYIRSIMMQESYKILSEYAVQEQDNDEKLDNDAKNLIYAMVMAVNFIISKISEKIEPENKNLRKFFEDFITVEKFYDEFNLKFFESARDEFKKQRNNNKDYATTEKNFEKRKNERIMYENFVKQFDFNDNDKFNFDIRFKFDNYKNLLQKEINDERKKISDQIDKKNILGNMNDVSKMAKINNIANENLQPDIFWNNVCDQNGVFNITKDSQYMKVVNSYLKNVNYSDFVDLTFYPANTFDFSLGKFEEDCKNTDADIELLDIANGDITCPIQLAVKEKNIEAIKNRIFHIFRTSLLMFYKKCQNSETKEKEDTIKIYNEMYRLMKDKSYSDFKVKQYLTSCNINAQLKATFELFYSIYTRPYAFIENREINIAEFDKQAQNGEVIEDNKYAKQLLLLNILADAYNAGIFSSPDEYYMIRKTCGVLPPIMLWEKFQIWRLRDDFNRNKSVEYQNNKFEFSKISCNSYNTNAKRNDVSSFARDLELYIDYKSDQLKRKNDDFLKIAKDAERTEESFFAITNEIVEKNKDIDKVQSPNMLLINNYINVFFRDENARVRETIIELFFARTFFGSREDFMKYVCRYFNFTSGGNLSYRQINRICNALERLLDITETDLPITNNWRIRMDAAIKLENKQMIANLVMNLIFNNYKDSSERIRNIFDLGPKIIKLVFERLAFIYPELYSLIFISEEKIKELFDIAKGVPDVGVKHVKSNEYGKCDFFKNLSLHCAILSAIQFTEDKDIHTMSYRKMNKIIDNGIENIKTQFSITKRFDKSRYKAMRVEIENIVKFFVSVYSLSSGISEQNLYENILFKLTDSFGNQPEISNVLLNLFADNDNTENRNLLQILLNAGLFKDNIYCLLILRDASYILNKLYPSELNIPVDEIFSMVNQIVATYNMANNEIINNVIDNFTMGNENNFFIQDTPEYKKIKLLRSVNLDSKKVFADLYEISKVLKELKLESCIPVDFSKISDKNNNQEWKNFYALYMRLNQLSNEELDNPGKVFEMLTELFSQYYDSQNNKFENDKFNISDIKFKTALIARYLCKKRNIEIPVYRKNDFLTDIKLYFNDMEAMNKNNSFSHSNSYINDKLTRLDSISQNLKGLKYFESQLASSKLFEKLKLNIENDVKINSYIEIDNNCPANSINLLAKLIFDSINNNSDTEFNNNINEFVELFDYMTYRMFLSKCTRSDKTEDISMYGEKYITFYNEYRKVLVNRISLLNTNKVNSIQNELDNKNVLLKDSNENSDLNIKIQNLSEEKTKIESNWQSKKQIIDKSFLCYSDRKFLEKSKNGFLNICQSFICDPYKSKNAKNISEILYEIISPLLSIFELNTESKNLLESNLKKVIEGYCNNFAEIGWLKKSDPHSSTEIQQPTVNNNNQGELSQPTDQNTNTTINQSAESQQSTEDNVNQVDKKYDILLYDKLYCVHSICTNKVYSWYLDDNKKVNLSLPKFLDSLNTAIFVYTGINNFFDESDKKRTIAISNDYVNLCSKVILGLRDSQELQNSRASRSRLARAQ